MRSNHREERRLNTTSDELAAALRGDAKALKALARDKSAAASRALAQVARQAKGFDARDEAVVTLSKRVGDSAAFDALVSITADKKAMSFSNIGTHVVEAIARHRDARVVACLVKLTRSPRKARAVAIASLAQRVAQDKSERGNRSIAAAFAGALRDDSRATRYDAASGLVHCPDARALAPLITCARDKSVDVRLAAYRAIAAIDGPNALAALEAIARTASKAERTWTLDKLIARRSRA
ncbi:MAG: HEAT repeat domain-containing protein [Myxococcota bacterium]